MSLCEKKGLILERWKTSQALGFHVSTLAGWPACCWAEAALLSPAFIVCWDLWSHWSCSASPANCPASSGHHPPAHHQQGPIGGNVQAATEEKSMLYLVGECKWKLEEWEGGRGDLCPSGRVNWTPHLEAAVLLCHRSQKASQAFSSSIFFPLYNPFLLTIGFEDKLENKSNVTFTPISLKGRTKSSKLKLLLNSVYAHVHMHHLRKTSRTVSM